MRTPKLYNKGSLKGLLSHTFLLHLLVEQMHIFMGLVTQRSHSQGTKEEEVHACQCITHDKNKMDGRGHYRARSEIINVYLYVP